MGFVLITSFITVIFLTTCGMRFFPRLYTDGTFMTIPARIMIGIAVLVCGMNILLRFLPGISSSWLVFIILLAFTGLSVILNKGDKFYIHNKKEVICVIVLILFMLGWRFLAVINIGNLVPTPGTGTHDELWYIFRAYRLLESGLREVSYQNDPNFPLTILATGKIGTFPRSGSESLILFFSSVSGANLEQVYPVLFALASVLFCFSVAQGFVNEVNGDWRLLALSLFVVAISPTTLFIFGNQNYATLWGLIFLGGYYWNLHRALLNLDSKGEIIASGIFLGALTATYPELLSIAFLATLILFFQSINENSSRWFMHFKALCWCAAIGVIMAPYAVFEAITSLYGTANSMLTNGPTAGATAPFSLTAANFLLTILTFDTGILWTSSPPSGFTSRYAERARLPHTLHTQAIHALSVHTLIAALPRPERRGLRSMLLDQKYLVASVLQLEVLFC